MKIAAAAYPLDWFDDWSAYEAKITRWVERAAGQGAEILVFPEYGAMELASLGGRAVAADQEGCLHEVSRHKANVDALHSRLAAEHGVHILGASGPVFDPAIHPGRPVNRATFYGPDGVLGHQDKAMMTRWERDDWDIAPGTDIKLFATPKGPVGVSICYDSEFPLLARSLAEAGAEILLVPSATETLAGFTRVRVGAMARALENQMVAVHSPVVGNAPWCAGMEENTGRAAIYGPPDRGFPPEGILAEGGMGEPGWVIAEVSLEAIREVRADGGVLNLKHWPEQTGPSGNVIFVNTP
ncbi:carbon-nitrogen hydrolase family protein [Defluviimonas sp. WL0002]|uniref:Carbon-nitrogen hydrolase family protein n=1 Tax=Albidovulum marisflavi TaxID=2984159 RepID=A0ABT2ZHN2_9RHOB|nr:carbon-nitrogen hydrolase family protein [Defluviimonas sp. WL0002]MCV2870241.1 carbon-nitrogen hydrolase family protein [Defluviimonas sp. WL0002]